MMRVGLFLVLQQLITYLPCDRYDGASAERLIIYFMCVINLPTAHFRSVFAASIFSAGWSGAS